MAAIDSLSREKASSLLQEHAAPAPALTLTEAPAPAGVMRFAARLWTPLYATAFYLWLNAAAAALTGFIFWAMAARVYDAGDLGRGAAALSAVMLMVGIANLGLGIGVIRVLPETGDGGVHLVNAVFTATAIISAVLSLIFLAGLPLWMPELRFLIDEPLRALGFVATVVLSAVSLLQTSVVVAIRRSSLVLWQTASLQMGRLAIMIPTAVLFGTYGLIVSLGVATALSVAVGYATLMRGWPGYRPAIVFDRPAVRRILPYSMANHLSSTLVIAPGLVLPLIVVRLLGNDEAAYFTIAWFLGYLLTAASSNIASSLLAEGSQDPSSLGSLSRDAALGALAISVAGALLLVLVGDNVLLLFGADYASEGSTLLRLVAVAAPAAALLNVYLGVLSVAKRVWELVWLAALVAVVTIALSSALLPAMGLAGAGIGYVAGQSLGCAIVLGRLLGGRSGRARGEPPALGSAVGSR